MMHVSNWLRQCSTWKVVLAIGVTFPAVFALIASLSWLWFGHVNASTAAGSAAGTVLATTAMGLVWRADRW